MSEIEKTLPVSIRGSGWSLKKSAVSHLAVTDAVDNLVVFTIKGVCQEAKALQKKRRPYFSPEIFPYWIYSSLDLSDPEWVQKMNECINRRKTNEPFACTYLGGQLLLPVHQALDVRRVVATALAGRDGALKGGAGDL